MVIIRDTRCYLDLFVLEIVAWLLVLIFAAVMCITRVILGIGRYELLPSFPS